MVYIHEEKTKCSTFTSILTESVLWWVFFPFYHNFIFTFLSFHSILEQKSHWPSGSSSWYYFTIGSASHFFLASGFSFGYYSHTGFSRRFIGYLFWKQEWIFRLLLVFISFWLRMLLVNLLLLLLLVTSVIYYFQAI